MSRCTSARLAAPCVALAALIVAGCQTQSEAPAAKTPAVAAAVAAPGNANQTSLTFTRFPDMPIPAEGEFDLNQTLVFGTEDAWFGRMVLRTQYSPDDMFEFYQTQMPAFGWRQVTAVRAATNILSYARRERIATLQIQGTQQLGTEVSIIVSPRGTQDNRTVPPSEMPDMPPGHGG